MISVNIPISNLCYFGPKGPIEPEDLLQFEVGDMFIVVYGDDSDMLALTEIDRGARLIRAWSGKRSTICTIYLH